MFEGAIAAFLNRLLGKYVEDLDTEQFNVGIFSGDTCLTDLKLKSEALYQLGLPIRVEAGLIGKIVLKIPWASLFSQPIVICIEDVYIVAVPATYGPYDAEVQKKLIRAEKRKILEDLHEDDAYKTGISPELVDGLLASVRKNFQITINNLHIRYEETLLNKSLCACGICVQTISVTTTNNKWKPGISGNNSNTVYQLVRAESLSAYMDPDSESSLAGDPRDWDMSSLLAWKSTMYRALQTFGMRNRDFQFLLKPFSARIKLIIHRGTENQSSRMLIDVVLQDVAMQVSEAQYVTFCQLYDSLLRAVINRPHSKYRPEETPNENPSSWWRYAYNSILDYNVKPYTWRNVFEHRRNYRKYKDTRIETLQRPNDMELKLDSQKYEDNLTILNIVIAREHARQELKNGELERECTTKATLAKQNAIESMSPKQERTFQNGSVDGQDSKRTRTLTNGSGLKMEKFPRPIDYKINFTLGNCSLCLLNTDREVLVITVTQLLTSIETRAALSAYKISARAESFVIEGVSLEGDLVPLITVDNVLTGNVSTNFLAIDFEKNQSDVDPLFDLSVKLEALEITYHHTAILEVINFFKLNDADVQTTILWTYRVYEYIKEKILDLVEAIVSQTLRISFKIDIKAPYIVFPEHGSIQKGGYMLVVDFGKVSLYNQLQAPDVQLENATLMELDELLYDRVHIVFSGCQVLCCHSGDDWRMARKKKDSEFHVVPKIQTVTTIAYSIKPEYHQLSRTKVSVSVTSLKFNLSETKLRLMMHFLNLLLVVYQRNIEKYENDFARCVAKKTWSARLVLTKELHEVQRSIYLPSITRVPGKVTDDTKELLTNSVPKLDRSVGSSEISQEDLELLSKTISLSGFDDNVSPCNHINLMLRFVIGELSIHLACLHHGREEPYLNLRIGTLRLTAALMEYGPAIQFDIGSILLVDKTNAGVTGSYLELISTDEPHEILRVSYRKVRSNCPDFKSHFKSIERQLVINILNVNLNLHRPALLNIRDYWQNIVGIFEGSPLFKFVCKICRGIVQYTTRAEDPPIPPGAIKLKYYASLDTLVLRFCDKETDLLEIRVLGLESDCSYIANERMYLSAHLRHLQVEDLNEETLYGKILTTEGDKVFDLKYGRHTPKLLPTFLYPENVEQQDDVMTDGTFKFTVGRINCVLLAKVLHDLKHFFSPFTSNYCTQLRDCLSRTMNTGLQKFMRSATKLHVFVTIDGFIFLLPQRKDVPTLLVFNTGQLWVENFFKKVDQPIQAKTSTNDTNPLVINNILVQLKSMSVSRALMMLTRDLEIQEPIVEPIRINFDIKRKVEYRNFMDINASGLFQIQGTMDFVNVNLSQRDLKTAILVWKDNVSKLVIRKEYEIDDQVVIDGQSMKSMGEDPMVKKLEDFLSHNESAICEVNAKLTLEGFQLNLFLDSDEVLSSPVRDLSHVLCKLTFGELINTFAIYSDKSLKMKLSLQSCVLQDTRKESRLIRKIIQSPAEQLESNSESCISVSRSPIVDISFTRAPGGERCVDALIQDIRINLSVPFAMHLTRYILDSLPTDQVDEGIINRAYECNHQPTSRNLASGESDKLKYARYFKEEPDASVSIRIQKPEILLFGEAKTTNSQVVLLQAEITIESSRHNCSSSIVCTLSDVHAKCKRQENYLRQPPYWLLCPCDVEICRTEEGPDFNVNYTATLGKIDLHLSVGIIHTFIDILTEATCFLDSLYVKSQNRNNDGDPNMHMNLWTPKKISNVPYKKFEYNDTDLFNLRGDKVVTIIMKPALVCILLEMEYFIERLPIVKIESTVSSTISDWYNNFNLESSIKLHAFCYNIDYKCWEPLIDLCTEDDVQYKPWELIVKMRHGEAFMINSSWTDPRSHVKQDACSSKKRSLKSFEQDSMDMIFITPEHLNVAKSNDTQIYSKYEDDSDTDDEEGHKKLGRSAHCLFQDNSSEDEESESDDSSSNGDDVMEAMLECNVDSFGQVGRESIKSNDLSTYITISSEEKLNFVVTPNTIAMLDMMIAAFVQTKSGIPIVPTSIKKLNLHNDIGHASRIELLEMERTNEKSVSRIIAVQDYEVGSPLVTPPSSPEHDAPTSPQLIENEIDFAAPNANLQNHSMLLDETLKEDSSIEIYKSITGEILHVVFEGFEDLYVCCPKRKGCNLVPLRPVRHEVRYHLIIEASIDKHLHRTISVRSPLQFRNETSYALGLYYKKSLLDKLGLSCIGEPANPFDDNIRMAIIEPDSVYSIPLYVAYHFPVHVLPTYLGDYRVSESGVFWKELCTNNTSKDICCKSKSDQEQSVFCVKVSCTETRLSTSPGCQVPNYLIGIHPPLILNNQLPFVLDVNIPAINYDVKIEPGERINMHSLSSDGEIQFVFKIANYLGSLWTGTVKLNRNMEKKLVQMSTESGSDLTTPFYISIELCEYKSWQIVMRAQYWIINKSRLPLYLQVYETLATYEIPGDEFLVFAQKNNKKSMVRLRAHQSEWSQPFGIDGLTSASLIVCKDAERRRKYKILTDIETSRLSPHFTKIIQFLPSFVISNNTKRTLRIMEENDQADLWYYLSPGEDMTFWPVTESMKMRIKWKNSQLVSQHFDMTQTGKTVLRMDNGTAVCVEIEGGNNSPYYITFQKYTAGDIPVRIDNLCEELFLKVSQSNLGQVALVNPFQSLLYTWDDPTKPRELTWNIYNNKKSGYKAQFERDASGQELVPFVIVERRDGTISKSLANTRSWSEERHGSTSSDSNIYEEELKTANKSDHLQKDRTTIYWVSYMEGNQRVLLFAQHETVYLKAKSIIDPEPSRRELFLSLAGIGVSVVGNEFLKVPKELMYASLINSAAHWELYFGKKWRSLSLEMSAWLESKYTNSSKKAQLDNFLDADLVKMQMTKPFFGKLRRTYSPAVWLHWRTSLTLTYLQGYVHRLQVDNQLGNVPFPVVMHSNVQKGLTDYAGNRKLKHCVEFACLKQRKLKHDVYKGICLIMRELNINLQERFLLSLIDMIPKRAETKHSIAAKLRSDVSVVHGASLNKMNCSTRRRNVIESLYISPILIRLKLLADTEGPSTYNISDVTDYRNVVRFIFEYGEKGGFEKHAEFKFPFYQSYFTTIDNKQLIGDLARIYSAQAMQQFHVLIRSTTVLGNQYGYNFKAPGNHFYEPDSLLMYGDEIAEKLSHEIMCQLGYTTTDTTQTTVLNNPDLNAQKSKDSLYLNNDTPPIPGNQNFFSTEIEVEMSSLLTALTDSVHQEELKYFLKTLSKKTIVLFNTECSSLKTNTQAVADVIKRAQEVGHKFVSRIRLPRYLSPHKGVEVFSTHKARGMHLLNVVNKSRCTEMDTYWAHAALTSDGKSIALVSLQRLYRIEKGATWGSWNVRWTLKTDQLLSPPTVVNNKLILHVNNDEKAASNVVDWYLESDATDTLEWLCQKINLAMILNMENSICSRENL